MNTEEIEEGLIETTYLFCYRKIGNSQDAEDVAQDILVEAIKAIRSGKSFVSVYSWFWAMAKNRVNMFFRMKRFHAVELDRVEDVLESEESVENELLKSEEIRKLNHSVSRLSHLLRQVVILHYVRGMKIPDIAQALGVSEGTVKTRLHNAKKEIRTGMNEMKDILGRSSYAPAYLELMGNGHAPYYWNAVNDLMTKQIFVACANQAKTVREIADEIGVAPVYFEEKLNYLLQNRFIKETSKGRYLTDFLIYPHQVWVDFRAKQDEIFDSLGAEVTEIIRECEQEIRSLGFYGNDLPSGTLLWLLYYFAAVAMQDKLLALGAAEWEGKVPADNGKDYRFFGWVGYPNEQITETGKNNRVSWSNLHVHFKTSGYHDVCHANLFQHSPFPNRDSILNETNADLFMRIFDNPFLTFTPNEEESVAILIQHGYLSKRNGGIYPTMPIMTYEQKQQLCEILGKATGPLCAKYWQLICDAAQTIVLPVVRKDLLEEYAHGALSLAFWTLPYTFYYGMNAEEKPLDLPENDAATSKAICIYIKK